MTQMAKNIYARTEDKQISTQTSSRAHDKLYWATQFDFVFAFMSGCLYAILDWPNLHVFHNLPRSERV